ncbi:erythromycin esterase [Actinokineospora spheciospongiae]|nr:erythromycin esterase [Actinokineospora spheciospongiae]
MYCKYGRKGLNKNFNDTVKGMTSGLTDTTHPVDAAAVMGLLPNRPRVLALGEPTHGEDVLLHLRNDLFRQLVEQEGHRMIAVESDCMMGLVVDDHVTSGAGTLDEVMEAGFSHGFGASEANRELVRWMRAHNEGLPASERVRFAGIDGPLEMTHAASPGRPSPRSTTTSRPGWTWTCSRAPPRSSTACSAPTTGGPTPPR